MYIYCTFVPVCFIPPRAERTFFLRFSWTVHQAFLRAPAWSSNPLESLRNLYYWPKYSNFWILGFFNSVHLFDEICLRIFNSKHLKSPWTQNRWKFWDILTVLEIWSFQFYHFWQCALQCIKKVDLKKVFCTYYVVKFFILKDKLDLFFAVMKAETHSFPTAFVLHQSDQNWQWSRDSKFHKIWEDVKVPLAFPGL